MRLRDASRAEWARYGIRRTPNALQLRPSSKWIEQVLISLISLPSSLLQDGRPTGDR